ncbi:hypothetical protein HPB52_003855 [Rhipicephalus sanguineus]|uniref:Uncharacterized protein n=1 Tax=Rhipicephalus sanguineus TaxID=34632 RepID=A0A9D4PU36_RHISA|nr:hypothetical protein HPB52_003855 [Rhipicephalus sanguineus]
MDEGVRVIAVNPSGQQSMGPSCQSSLTKVYCGPVETIGMPAPPKNKGSRLDWRITPEGGLEVTVGRPLTKEEEEKRERDRKSKAAGAATAAAPADAAAGAAAGAAPAAAPAAPADAAVPPAGIEKLKKQICDPLSLLANTRLPICFETTLGKETAPGLTSVTVINEQPGSPVMVQPRAAPVPSGRGFSPPECRANGFLADDTLPPPSPSSSNRRMRSCAQVLNDFYASRQMALRVAISAGRGESMCESVKRITAASAPAKTPDCPGTSLPASKIPAHKVSKPARTLLRPKSLGLKAQKRRNPHSEDAPGGRSRLGLTKHPRRPNTGAGATPATGDPNAPVPMMPTAFEMDTAPPLCVTDAIQPLSSQIPVLSQTPAATPSASEAQTSTQQVSQRSSLPKCGNARPPPQRLAKCTTIVVKFQGYVDITRLNFSAVCQGILYAVQATATEKEDTYIKRRDVQNLIVVQTFRATIAHRLLQCANIIVSGTTYPIRCYNAFDNTYSRGVIHGIYPDITEDTLRSELTIQGRTIANVRRLGTTNTVLVIVEGEELPRHARLFSGVYNIYPERRKAAQCSSCQELGHRADVCRNRRTFVRCPHCSKTLPPEQEASEQSHECEQYCFLCDQHDHSPTSPNCSRKTVNIPRCNPAAEDSANTPQYSQPSAGRRSLAVATKPSSAHVEIVSRHCRTLVCPAPSTKKPSSHQPKTPTTTSTQPKASPGHHGNHRMPQAQRGDPQEDITDPRNRLREQAPHHHIKSSGGTNTTAKSSTHQVICSSDGGYGGCQSPTVTTCSAMGGGGGNFTGVRIRADSSSSMGRRCEQLLPEPCPAMQALRIVDDVGTANRRTSSRVVHIFEEPPAPPRSTRGSSRDRQFSARVVHIEEDCPEFP